ncbi:MAG TPA: DoxX family protein [Longimicrobiales bacterium]|jgi:putative oxidoreductase
MGTIVESAQREAGAGAAPGALSRVAAAAAPITHAALRIGAGLLFMQHGVQKLFGWLGGFGGQPGNTAELFSLFGLAGVLETFGGLLIVLGLFTRPVALVLVVEMVVAHFMVHQPRGGFPIQNGGELALLYALVFASLFSSGAGKASLDGRLAARRAR